MSGSGISWARCKSAPSSRQITTPAPHHSVFYRPDALPATQPTASKHWRQKSKHWRQNQSTEGKKELHSRNIIILCKTISKTGRQNELNCAQKYIKYCKIPDNKSLTQYKLITNQMQSKCEYIHSVVVLNQTEMHVIAKSDQLPMRRVSRCSNVVTTLLHACCMQPQQTCQQTWTAVSWQLQLTYDWWQCHLRQWLFVSITQQTVTKHLLFMNFK